SNGAYQELTVFLSTVLVAVTVLKLAFEAVVFRHGRSASSLQQTALLLIGELAEITTARFILGIIGGVLLPLVFIMQRPAPGFATLGVTVWVLVFLALGELMERYLFFTAAAPARMPGGIEA